MLNRFFIFIFLSFTASFFAQSNVNNPYSLYGLGVENIVNTGGLSGLGNTGIAQNKNQEINLLNPASLGNIKGKTFLQDLGVNFNYSSIQSNTTTQYNSKVNISHVSFAFPVKKGWGMGLGLVPYTYTGYEIDLESSIEGSTDTYTTRMSGNGGINRFYFSNGIKLWDDFSLGLDFSVLFGSITQESTFVVDNIANITDQNYYNGVRFKTGFQYQLPLKKGIKANIGGTVELPSVLKGTQTRDVYKVSPSGAVVTLESDETSDLDDFEFPLSFGLATTVAYKKITTSVDMKKSFWESTNQYSSSEEYVNQTTYGLGLEYKETKPSFNYLKNIKYRLGFNYNTGFLQISDKKISNYFVSTGLGLPMGRRHYINVSYAYGVEGTLNNNLIQEKYHKIGVNISLNGNWFKKRKIL